MQNNLTNKQKFVICKIIGVRDILTLIVLVNFVYFNLNLVEINQIQKPLPMHKYSLIKLFSAKIQHFLCRGDIIF